MAYPVCNKIIITPRAGFANRVQGGKIYGSNTSPTADLVELYSLTSVAEGANVFTFSNTVGYKYLLYKITGNYGDVAELRFYRNSNLINWDAVFGSAYFENNPAYDYSKPFDGDAATFYVGADNVNPNYLGIQATVAVPDTTPPTDVVLNQPSALAYNAGRFPFTPATDASGIQKYIFQFDTVNTFNSPNLIQANAGTNSPFDFTGLSASTRWYGRAKAVDDSDNHNASANWSNVVYLDTPAVPPPVHIVPVNPVPWAKIGASYQLQLKACGGSGAGTWSKTGGNLPSGNFSSAGLVSIPVVGSSNYTLTAHYSDANGSYDEISITIQVTQYDWISLCHKRPLPRKVILNQRIFTPLSGADEVIEDAAPKYEYTIQNLYIGRTEGDDLRQFLYDHRNRQPFYWYNPDRQETNLVKLMSGYDEEEMLAYGGFQIVLRDV